MEEWRDINGYEGYYQVSSLGRVRSLDRYCRYINGRVDFIQGKIKSQRSRKDGYLIVNLCRDSKKECYLIHHLVYAAFHGGRDPSLDVCHNDGDRKNNQEYNLRQDTRKGNLGDTLHHGTRCRGETHGAVKLTDAQVDSIRHDPRGHNLIASDYGVHKTYVSRIKRGKVRNLAN